MQSKQNKSETDILFDTAHFKWLKDSSAIAADSVKNLLRGLGVSELPNNLTTHF
jgi:trans-aconitate methyltransferase